MGTLFDLLGASGAVQGITSNNARSSRNGYNDANYAAKTAERIGELWSSPHANGVGGIFQQVGNVLATGNALSGLAGGMDRSVATTVKTHDAYWGAGEEPPRPGSDQYQAYPGNSRSYSYNSSHDYGHGGGRSSSYGYTQQNNTPQIYPAQPDYSHQQQQGSGNTRSFGTGRYDGHESHAQPQAYAQPQSYQQAPATLRFTPEFAARVEEFDNVTHAVSARVPREVEQKGAAAVVGRYLAGEYQQHPEQRAVIQQEVDAIADGNNSDALLASILKVNPPARGHSAAVTNALPEAASLGAPQPITNISNQPPAAAPAASPTTASLTAEDMRIINEMSVKDYTKAVQRIIGTNDDGDIGKDTIKKFKEKMGSMGLDADTSHDGKVNREDLGYLPTQMFKQIAQSARSAGK